MSKARKKGITFEHKVINDLKNIGFDCGSTRLYSKALDDKCVDIFFKDGSPFNIQCKAVEKLSPHAEIEKLPKDSNYSVLVHKRNRKGTLATMPWDDFLALIEILRNEKIL